MNPRRGGADDEHGAPLSPAFRSVLGYVPQDDIVHAELPLRRMLGYAARLRLPGSTPRAELEAAVARALDALDLAERAHVRVGALSGGQRKRASIAVELLTDPHVFFLDEPTSGLDPATGAELLEGVGRALGVRDLLLHGGSPLGPPLVRAYGDAGQQPTGVYWLYLALFARVFLAGAFGGRYPAG
ncbi:MAG TPA: ATP-binding cassette domain-containing protein [Gaiellaceae bacterium]|nr:ATP-binding cassette domain-containing protein [Gaiellaceae bacterium]